MYSDFLFTSCPKGGFTYILTPLFSKHTLWICGICKDRLSTFVAILFSLYLTKGQCNLGQTFDTLGLPHPVSDAFAFPEEFFCRTYANDTALSRGGGQVVSMRASTPRIRVRIPLKSAVFSGQCLFEKNENKQKEAELAIFWKNDSTLSPYFISKNKIFLSLWWNVP